MRKLPKWCITDKFPAIYDTESATVIEQTAKLYGAMSELISEYNEFVDNINAKIEQFEGTTEKEINEFAVALRQEFQDFIDTVELKLKAQDKEIEDAFNYIKANIDDAVSKTVEELFNAGNLDETVMNAVNGEATARQNTDMQLKAMIESVAVNLDYNEEEEALTMDTVVSEEIGNSIIYTSSEEQIDII